MNILPPIVSSSRNWPSVLCAWCGSDLNANDNIGSWDVREHFADCSLFLSSQEGQIWSFTEVGERIIAKVQAERTKGGTPP